jgi:hypothetical protein
MRNKLNVDLNKAIAIATIAREDGRISEATQQRLLRRINGPSEWDKLTELCAREENAKLRIYAAKMRARVEAVYERIAAEVASSPKLLAVRKAEQEIFLIEYRTPEQLEAERNYAGSKRIATDDKPEIANDADWWKAEEKKEREAKKAIRRDLKAGKTVDFDLLLKYNFIDPLTGMAYSEDSEDEVAA